MVCDRPNATKKMTLLKKPTDCRYIGDMGDLSSRFFSPNTGSCSCQLPSVVSFHFPDWKVRWLVTHIVRYKTPIHTVASISFAEVRSRHLLTPLNYCPEDIGV